MRWYGGQKEKKRKEKGRIQLDNINVESKQ